MTFMWPIGFVLLIPLALTLWLWRMPSRMLTVMRVITSLLILLAICGPAVRLPSRAGTVIVVTDSSQSMPANSDDLQREAIELIQSAMGGADSLGVVSFAQSSLVTRTPGAGKTPGGRLEMRRDASNLNDALDMALSLIPPESPGRIMVLSDGRWTGLNPTTSATRAAARRIGIDYRCMERTTANDTAIVRLDAPASVTPGESFMLTAWVRSPMRQEISYSLTGGGKILASGKRTVPSGLSRIDFRDKAVKPGTNSYQLTVNGGDGDPMPENNSARLLLGIRGPRPIPKARRHTLGPLNASARHHDARAGGVHQLADTLLAQAAVPPEHDDLLHARQFRGFGSACAGDVLEFHVCGCDRGMVASE